MVEETIENKEASEAPADEAEKEEEGAEAPASPKGNMLEQTQALYKGIKEEREAFAKLVKANQEAAATLMLSGHTNAGQPMKTPEQTEQEKIDATVAESMERYTP